MTARSDSSWYTWVALGLAATVVTGLIAGIGLGAGFGAPAARAASSNGGGSSSVDTLYLTIAFNPISGLDEYFPANFTVPAHTEVAVVITNYDNGVNAVPLEYTQVAGTVGDLVTWVNDTMAAPQTAGSVPDSVIAHTFTMNGGGYDLNVPVAAATPSGTATTVSFATYFNTTGTFTWQCMAPCDPTSMGTLGFMAGTVTVATA